MFILGNGRKQVICDDEVTTGKFALLITILHTAHCPLIKFYFHLIG